VKLTFMNLKTIDELIGKTPLVKMQRMVNIGSNTLLFKLEGNNPAGSIKDRPALSMISRAESKGLIKPGDTLIEATSGNTGIALAMVAAMRGYKMTLIMPENASAERTAVMKAYGAEIIHVSAEASMMGARDLAREMEKAGKGVVLDQFANGDNPIAHYNTTGPEIWDDTDGKVTHFVSSMGTTGTIVGTSRYLKEQNQNIQIVGVQPTEGSNIPGIRRWPEEYVPSIFTDENIDQIIDVSQDDAEVYSKRLAKEEGIFCGISSGGAVAAAINLAKTVTDSVIVVIVCDRGDRYVSTGVF